MVSLVLNILLLIWAVSSQLSIGWTIVFLIWTNSLVYGFRLWRERIFLISFLALFAFFLMSRKTLESIGLFPAEVYYPGVERHLVLTLCLALLGVWIGYAAAEGIAKSKTKGQHRSYDSSRNPRAARIDRDSIQKASVAIFWLTIWAPYVDVFNSISYVRGGHYAALYAQGFRESASSGFTVLAHQIGLVNNLAFLIFLGTLPALKQLWKPFAAWLGASVLSLLTGMRFAFAVAVVLTFAYLVAHDRLTQAPKMQSRRRLVGAAVAIPAMALLLGVVERVRGVGGVESRGLIGVISQFVYSQGVSVTTVTNGYIFADRIPNQVYLLEFLHSGLPARILGNPVFAGNSIERAINGGSYGMSLSYTVLGPDIFLSGRGTGTSFVAEAYADLGYMGVLLLGLGYGYLVWRMGQLDIHKPVVNGVLLLIAQSVLTAPRTSATGLLMDMLAPSTFVTVGGVLLLAYFISRSHLCKLEKRDSVRERQQLQSIHPAHCQSNHHHA